MNTYNIINKHEHISFTVQARNGTDAVRKSLGMYSITQAHVLGWQVEVANKHNKVHH